MTGPRQLSVLVLGAGSNVSQGILKALSHTDLPIRTLAGCVHPESAGLYAADRAFVTPFADDSTFESWLTALCERESIDAVLSGAEPVIEALSTIADRVQARTGAFCLVSAPDVLAIGQDKLITSRWLRKSNLPHPAFAAADDAGAVARLVDTCAFPLIAKPRRGRSSDGIRVLSGPEDLAALGDGSDLLLQDYVGSPREEFTVGCFSDRTGRCCGSVAMRRTLHQGTTYTAEVGAFPEVTAVAERIVSELRPLGPCNVQMRLAEGKPLPFEINVRFSGTTPARASAGVNEVEIALRHFLLGEPADVPEARPGVMARYWNEVYVANEAVAALRQRSCLDEPHRLSRFETWGFQP